MPELIFTVPAGAPPEYRLLADSLRSHVAAQDAVESLVEGPLPEARPDRVFVAVGALDRLARAPESQRARTIQVALAAPGSAEAWLAQKIAERVAVTLHPNFEAARLMAESGLRATHLQLGYEPDWDRYESRTATPLELIHGKGERAYFDWLRALLAIHRGSVVVHERCFSAAPLRPGRHIFVASRKGLDDVAAALEEDPARCRRVAGEAHSFISRLLPMSIAASALLGHARALLVQPCD